MTRAFLELLGRVHDSHEKRGHIPGCLCAFTAKILRDEGLYAPEKSCVTDEKKKDSLQQVGLKKKDSLYRNRDLISSFCILLVEYLQLSTDIHTYLFFFFSLFSLFSFLSLQNFYVLFIFPSGLLAFGEYNTITIPTPNHTSYLNNVVESSSLTSSPGRPLLWMPQKSSQSGSYVSLHAFFDDDVFVS